MFEFGWLPDQWTNLDTDEKALVIAGIDNRIEQEQKAQKQAERKTRS
ncbi:hypothetical protein LVISKB_2141 [Levilactobacillus brevis KB290]|uniref:Uncharacterized protein n=1 Tax=Levilactobacillus brevis KB290 TaxID=1001583 RepID=M5B1G5_LEVBR|nr:hypothetical protein [Levilactobacillus brevis]BAN07776.1 hypothetical protein LVISKB_2141 [Levilactobacillus brevis KB290]